MNDFFEHRSRFGEEGVLSSRMGTFVPGSHVVFRGQDLHRDLKDMDWLELYVYGITGRRFTQPQLKLLHAIWTYTSYPDVRLWNNRVAALAGSARSTGNLCVAAALAVSEASIYGRGIDKRAITFLLRTRERLDAGEELVNCIREELDAHRSIAGYGRPLINGDERNGHMLSLTKSLGLDDGKYLQLAQRVEAVLLDGRWRMKMNYGGLAAALCADVGLTAQEYYLFMFPAFLAGMQPCYIEAADNEEGALYALPCTAILYDGKPARSWKSSSHE
jgi:citrate synthase